MISGIVGFVLGGLFGVFLTALMVAADDDKNNIDYEEQERRKG